MRDQRIRVFSMRTLLDCLALLTAQFPGAARAGARRPMADDGV